jgi:hypothetical protein
LIFPIGLLQKKNYQLIKKMKKAGIEALRLMVLSIIPLLIIQIEAGEIDYRVLVVVAVVTLLRFIDKALHEYGKEHNIEKLEKGLTRF